MRDQSGEARAKETQQLQQQPVAGPSNCRLLWRGNVVTPEGHSLHGIAIIAHLFSVSANANGASRFSPALATASSSLSPFDDPFSSSTSATASGADMCLGLEMLRGAPITVKGDVRIVTAAAAGCTLSPTVAAQPGSGGNKDRKGKGKATQDPPPRAQDDVETIQVETPTDVRVYIDDRCPETVEWFQDKFCREGRQGLGLRFNAGGEEVVIFASLPEASSTASPTASTSSAPGPANAPLLPALTLLLGRPVRSKANQPRPDDPTPRENLFAKKLRKTASLPASSFPTTGGGPLEPAPPPPGAIKRRRQSAKDKAIASLLGGAKFNPNDRDQGMSPPSVGSNATARPKARSTSSQPALSSSLSSSRGLQRSLSSMSRFSSVEPVRPGKTTSSSFLRQNSLPPNANASRPLRRSASVSATTLSSSSSSTDIKRPFKRSLSRSSMLLESPPGSEDEDETEQDLAAGDVDGELVDRAFAAAHGREERSASVSSSSMFGPMRHSATTTTRARTGSRVPASPTPSVMSLAADEEEEDENDAVAELRGFRPTNVELAGAAKTASGEVAGRKRMARSSSLPVGQFALSTSASSSGAAAAAAKNRRTREGSSTSTTGDGGGFTQAGGDGEGAAKGTGASFAATNSAIETRNKNKIKKIAMNRMDALGCGKAHAEFKDIFSLTTRGVAFAMRTTFKTAPLSNEDRQIATDLIEQHLRMYMPVELFPLAKDLSLGLSTTEKRPLPSPSSSRQVERVREPPSPKSLGDDNPDDEMAGRDAFGVDAAPVRDAQEAQDEELVQTQVDMEEEMEVEETQLHEEEEATPTSDARQADAIMLIEDESSADAQVVQTLAIRPKQGTAGAVDAEQGDEGEDGEEDEDEIILVEMPPTSTAVMVAA
ncbi:hypothetical protein JCM10908_001490 [Rhodotorula pacifica]|uniref:uncharacterized protein n=1 Tax=Rhodotorula pacifica TaxID=1495444 RepID=UPI003171A47C